MLVITQWASRALEARGTGDRTVTFGEPDPAEAVTGQFESVELGRAVLLGVEQIDQLPGVRTDVRHADGHRPAARLCANSTLPWWWMPGEPEPGAVRRRSLRGHRRRPRRTREASPGCAGTRRAASRDRARGLRHAAPRPVPRSSTVSRSAVGHSSGEVPMSAGPGRPERGGARPRPTGCAPAQNRGVAGPLLPGMCNTWCPGGTRCTRTCIRTWRSA